MKKIFYLVIALLMISTISSQTKKLTLYYPDSTKVVNITGLDSMVIFICGSSKVSYGGKDYNTVLIGSQCWLKENLDIGTVINSTTNSTDNSIIEKYCYGNDPNNCNTYGGLYQWGEAMQYVQTEGVRGICPEGWHIPTEVEFNDFYSAVGGDGNSIKAVGQGSGSGAGTNTTEFSALLAGNKETSSSFMHLLMRGHFWSSTLRVSDSYVYRIFLWDDRSDISPFQSPVATYGFSVRCIKDY